MGIKERAAFLFVIRAVSCSIASHYADKTSGKEKLDKRKKGEMPSLCVAAFKLNSHSLGCLHLQTPNQLPFYSDRTTQLAVLSKTTALVPAEKSRRAVSDQRLLPARLMASSPLTCLSPKRREATGRRREPFGRRSRFSKQPNPTFQRAKGVRGSSRNLKGSANDKRTQDLGKNQKDYLGLSSDTHSLWVGRAPLAMGALNPRRVRYPAAANSEVLMQARERLARGHPGLVEGSAIDIPCGK